MGSTPIARHIYETAAANGKRVQAQGSAKNYIIVTESADIDYTAEKTASSVCACAGERCLSNDIMVVEDSVYDEFAETLAEKTSEQIVGYGLNNGVDIGAIISEDHLNTSHGHIDSGVEEGAELLANGRDVTVEDYDGTFIGPTLFSEVTPI